jgi:hypothetical protein
VGQIFVLVELVSRLIQQKLYLDFPDLRGLKKLGGLFIGYVPSTTTIFVFAY